MNLYFIKVPPIFFQLEMGLPKYGFKGCRCMSLHDSPRLPFRLL